MNLYKCKAQRLPMSSPDLVTRAISQPNFYLQKKSFWQMLCYLFSDYQGQKVHFFLQVDTFRKICLQLHLLMQSEDDFAVVQSNRDLLFHTYFLFLSKIRGSKTLTRMTVDETPELNSALYKLYYELRRLGYSMPLYGHPQHSSQTQ